MKFSIMTFGCQMNVCDSNWLEQTLISRGWEKAPEDKADLVLINTCSVREKPELKVNSLLGRLRRNLKNKPEFFVGVGGCVAQQKGEKFWHRFPFVRLVFGTDGLVQVPEALDRLLEEPGLKLSLLEFSKNYPERSKEWLTTCTQNQAYVNIMQGCDNFCAYCIVPYTRGRQKSRSSEDVFMECRELVKRGAKEITLLGQNVNSYGQDKYADGTPFYRLLQKVCSIPGLKRVRFTTSHPKDISDELIQCFFDLKNLCPGLHLPLQSGSNRILKSMGRKYTKEQYLRTIDKLRKARPEIVLSTDLIVGFPGETEEDFQETLEMVKEVKFDSSFSFKYSDRPFVRAAKMTGKVPDKIKSERLTRLQSLQDRLTLSSMQSLLGKRLEVLIEGKSPKQSKIGRTFKGREPGGRIVNCQIDMDKDLTGRLVQVNILQAKKHSVFGEVLQNHD